MRTNTAVIFDLDDTLIDTQKRHFNIVKDFLKEVGKSLDFEEYLNIRKKNNWPNSGIIKKVCPLKVDDFSSFWRLNIENMKYLKHDIEIVDTALLNELKTKRPCDFILLSLRSNPASAEEQF
ncbi:MAG: HAD hydrolase-like protein, partial [Ginsengibacter sp.]